MAGYVYFLRNEAMPGLIKIGMTVRNPQARISELYTTGVPLPFSVIASTYVDCPERVEAFLHAEFNEFRVNVNREFFRVNKDYAVNFLNQFDLCRGFAMVSPCIEYDLIDCPFTGDTGEVL